MAQPDATRFARTRSDMARGASASRPRVADRTVSLDRGGRDSRDPRALRSVTPVPARNRWGSLQGGLGVCIIVAGAAVGVIITMVTRSEPGFALGFFVVLGTIAAAFAVRPQAGRMIFPVPVLSYVVAALVSGIIFSRTAAGSRTALAIGAAQWVANGFFAMAIATAAALVIIGVRWFRWRRSRGTSRRPGPGTGGPASGSAARTRPARQLYPESVPSAGGRRPAGPRDETDRWG